MPEPRARSSEERAKAISVGVVVVLLCFATGLFLSLRGLGISIGPTPAQGLMEPQTVNGIVTYVQVDRGGHAVACASSYSASSCSTVGVVLGRPKGSK